MTLTVFFVHISISFLLNNIYLISDYYFSLKYSVNYVLRFKLSEIYVSTSLSYSYLYNI